MRVTFNDLCDSCRTFKTSSDWRDGEWVAEKLTVANGGSFSRSSKTIYSDIVEHLRKSGCTTCPDKLERAITGF